MLDLASLDNTYMGLLYTFIIAALALSALVVAKSRQLETGKPTFINTLLAKCDPFFTAVRDRIQYMIDHRRERAFFLFLVQIPSQIELFFGKLRVKTHDYYHGTNEKMRNKQNISGSTVSPYMRSMTLRRDTEGF